MCFYCSVQSVSCVHVIMGGIVHLHSMHFSDVSNCWSICSVMLPNVHALSLGSTTADLKSDSIMWSSFEARIDGRKKKLNSFDLRNSCGPLTASEIDGTASFAAVIDRSASTAYVFRLPDLNATIDSRTIRVIGDGRAIIKVHRAHAFVARMRRRFKFLTQMIHFVVMETLWQRGDLFLVCVD